MNYLVVILIIIAIGVYYNVIAPTLKRAGTQKATAHRDKNFERRVEMYREAKRLAAEGQQEKAIPALINSLCFPFVNVDLDSANDANFSVFLEELVHAGSLLDKAIEHDSSVLADLECLCQDADPSVSFSEVRTLVASLAASWKQIYETQGQAIGTIYSLSMSAVGALQANVPEKKYKKELAGKLALSVQRLKELREEAGRARESLTKALKRLPVESRTRITICFDADAEPGRRPNECDECQRRFPSEYYLQEIEPNRFLCDGCQEAARGQSAKCASDV